MRILCVTSVKDEAPYLVEWLAHYRGLGVSDFLVFTNDCSDGTDGLLEAVAEEGWLTRIDNPLEGKKTIQWQALNKARQHPLYQQADWVLVVDVDEFLALAEPYSTLPDLLGDAEGDAITLPWRLFGSGGHVLRPNRPTTEIFRNAAPAKLLVPAAHFFKSIFRPQAFQSLGVHRPRSGQPARWLDSALEPLPEAFARQNARITMWGHFPKAPKLQLNHYAVRSVEEFMAKRARGLPNKMTLDVGLAYWVSRNFNQERCEWIARHRDRTIELEAQLRTARVKALEETAIAYHTAQLAKRLKDKSETELYWSLVLAGGSFAPPPKLTQAHLTRLKEAHAHD